MSSGNESHSVDALVVDVVTRVRDRFGADGLRDLVSLAQRELSAVEQAEAGFQQIDDPSTAGSGSDVADTQAFAAFVEQSGEDDPDQRWG